MGVKHREGSRWPTDQLLRAGKYQARKRNIEAPGRSVLCTITVSLAGRKRRLKKGGIGDSA